MSGLESPFVGSKTPPAPAAAWIPRLESLLERASERLNPILVKEARQALKSRQFVITFSLLLCFGWGWTLLGVAILCAEMGLAAVFYAPSGRFMLIGYYLVLAIPLLIVVPFSAFRSLAAEREDGTFELLSITALSARQIITGKLGSAILQMMVYYSALSPCIAFTYLLRGLDIVTILLILLYTFLASLMLSLLGLLLATVTKAYHWQVFLSVILLAGLFLATYLWSTFIFFFLVQTPALDQSSFWIANLGCLMFYASFAVLFLETAASQLSFASDNRSTRLRVVMLIQQVLLIGWVIYGWKVVGDTGFLSVLTAWAAVYWAFMGTLMIGESGYLSPRAMRALPRSFLGRCLLTWFNPGSGTGYLFAVSNLLVCCLVAVSYGLLDFAQGRGSLDQVLWFAVVCFLYVVAYLGATRLTLLLLRRYVYAGIAHSLLLMIIFPLFGSGIPFFLDLAATRFQESNYNVWQTTNLVRVLYETLDENLFQEPLVPVLLALGAGVIFLLNLAFAAGEVERVRQETPQRVLEDDAPRATRRASPGTGPWRGDAAEGASQGVEQA